MYGTVPGTASINLNRLEVEIPWAWYSPVIDKIRTTKVVLSGNKSTGSTGKWRFGHNICPKFGGITAYQVQYQVRYVRVPCTCRIFYDHSRIRRIHTLVPAINVVECNWVVVHVDEDVGAENQKLKSFDSPDSEVGAGNNVVPKIEPVVLYQVRF
jgi:hypothetical protein